MAATAILAAVVVMAAAAAAVAVRASPPFSSCQGADNNKTIVEAKFGDGALRKHANGHVYLNTAVSPPVYVVHLYGSAYERGVALGAMMKPELQAFFDEFYHYLDAQIGQFIGFIPEPLRTWVEKFGIWAALEVTYLLTAEYTPAHYADEIKGMAEGSGVSEMEIWRVQMLPELVKAHCSMVGAWGEATSPAASLLQLRALDFMTDSPLQKYPAVIVYHQNRNDAGGHTRAFANVGWLGFQGSVTGISSVPLGMSEKVWLKYNGTDSREGYPFHFLLRDILEFDDTIEAAHKRMHDAKRTCSIFVGLGQPTSGANTTTTTTTRQYTISRYSKESVVDYELTDTWPGHPYLKDMLYLNKHTQPSHEPCLGELLTEQHGKLTADTLARRVAAKHGTGNLHLAVYDFEAMQMLVANAQPAGPTYAPAYSQTFVRYHLNALFAEKPLQ